MIKYKISINFVVVIRVKAVLMQQRDPQDNDFAKQNFVLCLLWHRAGRTSSRPLNDRAALTSSTCSFQESLLIITFSKQRKSEENPRPGIFLAAWLHLTTKETGRRGMPE